jgi:hypothetical protein
MRRARLDSARLPVVVRDFVFFRSGGEALSSAYEAVVPVRKVVVYKSQHMYGDQNNEQYRKSPSRRLRESVL